MYFILRKYFPKCSSFKGDKYSLISATTLFGELDRDLLHVCQEMPRFYSDTFSYFKIFFLPH